MSTHTEHTRTLPFRLGEPRSFGGLTVLPLFPAAEPRVEYIGLDEAVAGGLAIHEVDEAGAVELLLLKNPLAEHGARSSPARSRTACSSSPSSSRQASR